MVTWKRLAQITTLQFVARSTGDSGWNGNGSGTVDVGHPDANTITFAETGTWVSAAGRKLNFSNVYRWSLNKSSRQIRLEHLRFGPSNPLYLFDLEPLSECSWKSVSPHVCRDDRYSATMIILPDEIELSWTITGPKKDDTIEYTYR